MCAISDGDLIFVTLPKARSSEVVTTTFLMLGGKNGDLGTTL
jgi:hypothetical protein